MCCVVARIARPADRREEGQVKGGSPRGRGWLAQSTIFSCVRCGAGAGAGAGAVRGCCQLTFLSASFACASDMMAAFVQTMADKMFGLVPRSRSLPSRRVEEQMSEEETSAKRGCAAGYDGPGVRCRSQDFFMYLFIIVLAGAHQLHSVLVGTQNTPTPTHAHFEQLPAHQCLALLRHNWVKCIRCPSVTDTTSPWMPGGSHRPAESQPRGQRNQAPMSRARYVCISLPP